MGEIFALGLLRAGWDPSDLKLAVRRAERVRDLEFATGSVVTMSVVEAAAGRDVVIIAVKPKDIRSVLAEITDTVTSDQMVVSIAAFCDAMDRPSLGQIPNIVLSISA